MQVEDKKPVSGEAQLPEVKRDRRWPEVDKDDFIRIIKKYKSRKKEPEDITYIDQDLGGTDAIARKLGVDISMGLPMTDVADRQAEFGSNERPLVEAEIWFTFF